mmetsp:Transcript_39631/g.93100  ORF Transcript_39631/g.93100 Transcript_39631/m.93100 type:complete len:201 (+) Transcript_39631:445-1047(+)
MCYALLSLLGCLVSPLFFSLHLLDFAQAPTIQIVLESVFQNVDKLAWVGGLVVLVIYLYSVLGYTLFWFEHEAWDKTCSTVFQCLITYLNEGLKSDGITDVLFRPSEVSGYPKSLWSDPAELLKILWDLSFYILVVIVLLALVAGIIIDSFGALRDESTKKMDLLRNVCIVCGQTRTAFQDIPGGFEQHVRVPRVLLGVD